MDLEAEAMAAIEAYRSFLASPSRGRRRPGRRRPAARQPHGSGAEPALDRGRAGPVRGPAHRGRSPADRTDHPVVMRPDWEPWEARRLAAPPGLPLEVREARSDVRLLLYVTRARFRDGTPPWDLPDRLAGVAQDERLPKRGTLQNGTFPRR